MPTPENPTDPPALAATRDDSPVAGLVMIGGVLVAAGVVAGLIMAFRAHGDTATGVILLGASLFAGVLLGIVAAIARRVEGLPRLVERRAGAAWQRPE